MNSSFLKSFLLRIKWEMILQINSFGRGIKEENEEVKYFLVLLMTKS